MVCGRLSAEGEGRGDWGAGLIFAEETPAGGRKRAVRIL